MTTIYKKEGRRYIPIGLYERECLDYIPHGFHLVYCPDDQSGIFRWKIKPAEVGFEAAALAFKEAVVKAMGEASKLRPVKRVMTAKEKRAYKAYVEIMGDGAMYFEYPTWYEIANAGIEAVRKAIQK